MPGYPSKDVKVVATSVYKKLGKFWAVISTVSSMVLKHASVP